MFSDCGMFTCLNRASRRSLIVNNSLLVFSEYKHLFLLRAISSNWESLSVGCYVMNETGSLLRAVSAQRPIEKGAHVKMMFAR